MELRTTMMLIDRTHNNHPQRGSAELIYPKFKIMKSLRNNRSNRFGSSLKNSDQFGFDTLEPNRY